MMYEEFNNLAGMTADPVMYQEIEEVYLAFEELTKKEMVAMYWGFKNGAYGLYKALIALKNEKHYLEPAIKGLRDSGLEVRANELEQELKGRVKKVIDKVKALNLNDCKEFKQ